MRLNRTRLAIKHLLSKVSVVYESKYIQSVPGLSPISLSLFLSPPASFSRFFPYTWSRATRMAVINRVRVGIPSTERATCCSVRILGKNRFKRPSLLHSLRSTLFQLLSPPSSRSLLVSVSLIISLVDFFLSVGLFVRFGFPSFLLSFFSSCPYFILFSPFHFLPDVSSPSNNKKKEKKKKEKNDRNNKRF